MSSADRQKIAGAMGKMRSTKATPGEQDRAVEELLGSGDVGSRQLSTLLEKQLPARLAGYRSSFSKRASQKSARHLERVTSEQINALRQTVLSLKDDPNLTKEMIVEKDDPAVARLHELLTIDRQVVLEGDEPLQAARADLLRQYGYLLKCHAALNLTKNDNPPTVAEADARLSDEEQLMADLAMSMDARNREILSANASRVSQLDPQEAAAINACNATRVLLGLNVLEIDLKLCAAARDHSKDMSEKKFFSHESPVEGKKRFTDRARNFGTTASAENIHSGSKTGLGAHLVWLHSPGHHRNLLGNHRRIGVGRHERLYTEMFGR